MYIEVPPSVGGQETGGQQLFLPVKCRVWGSLAPVPGGKTKLTDDLPSLQILTEDSVTPLLSLVPLQVVLPEYQFSTIYLFIQGVWDGVLH